MARDLFHDVVKNALIKDGWQITDDPFHFKVGGVDVFIDLGAERLIAAERNDEKIAVEIKSFMGNSSLTDFHLAIGQFLNYRLALKLKQPNRLLFLAIPKEVYQSFFMEEFTQLSIAEYSLKIIVFDIQQEEILQWIT